MIDEMTGEVTMIDSPLAREIAADLGIEKVQRASHVLPCNRLLRTLFVVIRSLVSDESRIAAWTRTWRCLWYVDATPAGGEVLPGRWSSRAEAIAAEIEYLNRLFAQ